MAEQCSPEDKNQVKAILEAVNQLNRDELIAKIKRCAKQTELSAEELRSSIEKISDITLDDLEEPPPGSPLEPASSGASLEPASLGSPGASGSASEVVGGKRKSKKNKSKKSKSKKSKSKKRRSKDVSIER